MADLVLVSNPASGEEGHPPLGLAYIASYLEKNSKFSVKIVDKEKNIAKAVAKENPSLVGITSVTIQFPSAIKLAQDIRSEMDVPIAVGGEHITALPQQLPSQFDIGVIGEGEQTILELMKIYSKGGSMNSVEGIVFHKGNDKNNNKNKSVTTNPPRKLIEPLDSIPFPSRHLLKMDDYLAPRRTISKIKLSRGTHIFTSRGCPYNCVFCSSSCFWQRRIRFNSPEYVVSEINHLIEKYKVDGICIFDDLFIADKERLRKISELVKKEKINEKVSFRCSVRTNLINDDVCKFMKDMNVETVTIGFESGSPRMLAYLKNNTATIEDNKRSAELLHKYGFEIEGLFMLASPGETKADMMMTLDFIKNNFIDTIQLSITTPYPGTELWNYALEKGLVSNDMDWSKLDLKPNEDLTNQLTMVDTMTKQEFAEIYDLFRREVEKRNVRIASMKNMFSLSLIKRGMQNPRKVFNYLYYSMKKKL